MQLEANPPSPHYCRWKYETLEGSTKVRPKPSIKKPPILELKPLPSHLKYVFLEKNDKLPIIISSSLMTCRKTSFFKFLENTRKH